MFEVFGQDILDVDRVRSNLENRMRPGLPRKPKANEHLDDGKIYWDGMPGIIEEGDCRYSECTIRIDFGWKPTTN